MNIKQNTHVYHPHTSECLLTTAITSYQGNHNMISVHNIIALNITKYGSDITISLP